MIEKKLAIVVPCYNESKRLPVGEFKRFLKDYPQAAVCFVNDASTDNTAEVLKTLQPEFKGQLSILEHAENKGKAEAVRTGVRYCQQQKIAPALAYLDADLATSLEECYSYLSYLEDKDFVFASRILKVGSVVERKYSRFLVGRVIATAISNALQIKVYDTQCGCKVFKAHLTSLLFDKPFVSTWLFDVELFSRLLVHFGPEEGLRKMEEIPVKRWVDRGASKVKISYFFRLWRDLYLIRQMHRKALKASG